VGVFETPQDSNEWAEKKHLLRYCHKHNNYFDPSIGCKDCESEQASIELISKEEFDPFRACKSGYKLHAGSYWKKVDYNETPKQKGIMLTDSEGIWVKVSMQDATYKIETKESPIEPEKTERLKSLSDKLKEDVLCPKCDKPCEKYGSTHSYSYYQCSNPECKNSFGIEKLRKNTITPPDIQTY
jgi:hypothetical protein